METGQATVDYLSYISSNYYITWVAFYMQTNMKKYCLVMIIWNNCHTILYHQNKTTSEIESVLFSTPIHYNYKEESCLYNITIININTSLNLHLHILSLLYIESGFVDQNPLTNLIKKSHITLVRVQVQVGLPAAL